MAAGWKTFIELWAALSTVGVILLGWAKAWKIIFGNEFGKDVKAGFPLFMKWWFRDEIRHKEFLNTVQDLSNKIDLIGAKVVRIEEEVSYNGGSTTKDATRRTESAVKELKTILQQERARNEIMNLCSDKMLFKVDTEGRCISISDAFLKAFSWQDIDVLGFGFEDLVREDCRQEMRSRWEKAIRTKTAFRQEQWIRDSSGEYHHAIVKAFPVIIDGELLEFSGTIEVL